jgi:hypothetical protein
VFIGAIAPPSGCSRRLSSSRYEARKPGPETGEAEERPLHSVELVTKPALPSSFVDLATRVLAVYGLACPVCCQLHMCPSTCTTNTSVT